MPPTPTTQIDVSSEAYVQAELKGRPFGRVLTKLGKVTRDQVHAALALQQKEKKGKRLGEVLVEMGLVTQDDVRVARAGQLGIPSVSLKGMEISEEAIKAIVGETARAYKLVPIEFKAESRRLKVAIHDPENHRACDDLRNLMGFKVSAVLAPEAEVQEILTERYKSGSSLKSFTAVLAGSDAALALEGRGDSVDMGTLADAASDNNVVQYINLLLMQAIREKASDIHLEPFEDEFKVRYRIDGVLYEMDPVDKSLAMAIVSRVKVMSKLDIAERRVPQDGRIELTIAEAPVDLRVAVLPTMFGESVVMRILDRGNVQLSLDRIGLREDDLEHVRTLINKPNGIVVVTGPTGSGKTTTLYAALNELNQPDTKILTAEDPVEYDIAGMVQCQVNADQELTFARLLRSFLRQDPDIILVGEIRDLETAQIAIQASLTGHLVFTTLHTNDAPSSVLRLMDLGVETFLLTATVEAIVAQRLVRRICQKCKESFTPSEEQVMELGLRPEDIGGRQFFRGRGCDACMKSGYKGRLALFEILTMDDTAQANTAVLRTEARKRGMRTLRESGLLAIYDGQTTIDEVVRETITED
ncbi:MAG: pilus assembly protein PilB [Planctomycetes bacterium]|nr:pilus assembly protein PilB [Planctomycetota bacterium]